MIARLKGVVVVVAGLLIVAAIIWWGWPILQITIGNQQRDSRLVRLILIALVVGGWVAFQAVKWIRAKAASSQLMAAVAKSAPKEQPSAEALKLRERFEEAVAGLRKDERRGQTLYELPWYVIIGAPGAGKTTVLVNSGLRFPTAQRGKSSALRGVGGTRNCDWWFTDEAVFLDTAGRYTTQDSDPGSDSAAWGEFLSLLKKYRPRRPLNGVIVAISALDVMAQGHAAREEHVAAVRRRIEELNDRLGIRLPIYVLVTKCDLVAGFSEYFDDLTAEGRAQVWGVTFSADRTRNAEAAESYPEEFDALVGRLNERVLARVEDEHDSRRRVSVFGFPQQMAALREPLTQFVHDVFASTKFERAIQLRGVYFTSGTQEGTPVDRLLGALVRRFGMTAEAVTPGGRGKVYFIEHLLKSVVIPESGLAGVNRRLELRKGALQLAAYVGMAACALLLVVLFALNYRAGRAYLDGLAQAVRALKSAPPVGADSPRDAVVRRLDAVRVLKDAANEAYLPFYRRWVLYAGGSAGEAAELAYASQLNTVVVPRVAAALARRVDSGGEPEALYDALRAYLVLGSEFQHFQKAFLNRSTWDEPGRGDALAAHLDWLLDRPQYLRPVELDADLVKRARNAIRLVSPERLVYRYVINAYEQASGGVRIDEESGIGASRVLRFKSGRPLDQPIPALYTKDVFNQIAGGDADALRKIVASRTADNWVWGERGAPDLSADVVKDKVLDLYEADYIAKWDGIVGDLATVSMSNLTVLKNVLNDVTSEGSPLRGVLVLITKHTKLIEPPKEEAKKNPLVEAAPDAVKQLFTGSTGAPRGAKVTAHFAPYHRAVAELEPLLGTLSKIKEQLATSGEGIGQKPPTPETQASTRDLAASLEARSDVLPEAIAALPKQIASSAKAVVGRGAATSFYQRYGSQVVPQCELVRGRYPFVEDSQSIVPLDDFANIFGYGGTLDRFANEELQSYADVSRTPLRWRSDSPVRDDAVLAQFDAARRIRDLFFKSGSKRVELEFDVRIQDVNLTQQSRNEVLFVLELDEHKLQWEGIERPPTRVKWPGSRSVASATWRTAPPVVLPDAPFDDQWAWFRLVDRGTLERNPQQDTRYLLTLRKGGRTAELVIQAANVQNPFAAREALRAFRCATSGGV